MNLRHLIRFILLILAIAIGGLFWYGEKTIKKANQSFTSVGFENPNDKTSLVFFINNHQEKDDEYTITYLINNASIDSEKITVLAKSKKIVFPKKTVLEKTKTTSRDQEVVIKVKTKKNDYYLQVFNVFND